MSTFDKRKKYLVSMLKTKKKNKKVIEYQEKKENSEEIKELLVSKLIENNQIENY